MTEPTKPIDDELRKKLDNIVMAITNYGHQVIHEQHSEEKSYVYGTPDPLVITRIGAVPLLVELITADRKQLLDRVEKEVIGEDVFVPKPEKWIDGPADKLGSYHNNYEIVQYAKRENEIKKHTRTALAKLRKQMIGEE